MTNRAHLLPFRPEQTPERFTGAKALILGSLFRAPFDDPEAVYSVVKTAKEAGEAVFADTKLPNFRALRLGDLRDSLPLLDCITPNEDEAKFFTGQEAPEKMADVFLEAGVKSVIIKLGPDGCYWKNEAGEKLRLPGQLF